MRHWHGKILALGLLAGLVGTELQAAAPTGRVVATGIGVRIHESELDAAYRRYVMTQAAGGVDVSPLLKPSLQKRLLNDLVQQRLLGLRAQAGDRTTADLKAEEMYEKFRGQFFSEKIFQLHLEARDLTATEFRRQLKVEMLADVVARRELQSKIQKRESDLLKYYNEGTRRKQWNVPGQAKVLEVFISVVDPLTGGRLNADERAKKLALATKVYQQARQGIDFKQLVKEFSQNPVAKAREGEVLLVAGQAEAKLEQAVFALKVNQIGPPMESQQGYHVVKMLEHTPARVKPFAEVRDDIRKHLHAVAFQEALPDYLKQLRKQFAVRIMLPE